MQYEQLSLEHLQLQKAYARLQRQVLKTVTPAITDGVSGWTTRGERGVGWEVEWKRGGVGRDRLVESVNQMLNFSDANCTRHLLVVILSFSIAL